MSTNNGIYPSKKHKLDHPSTLLSSLHSISSALHSITSCTIPALLQLACVPTNTNTTIHETREIGDLTEESLVNCLASDITKLSHELQSIVNAKTTKLFETVLLTTMAQWSSLLPAMSLTFLAATSSAMFKLLKPATSEVLFICPRTNDRTVVPFRYFQPSTLLDVYMNDLPDFPSVTKVVARDTERAEMDKDVNLTRITHWTFHEAFNLPIPPELPPFLTHLTFGADFNQHVDGLLPKTLTHLTFGSKFNHSVEKLPPLLRVLTFGYAFNHTIDNLPQTVRELVLGFTFSQYINILPPFLTRLEIRSRFPNSIITFPLRQLSSLQYLSIRGGVDSLDNLPYALTELYIFTSSHFRPMITKLPTSVKKLGIEGYWESPLDFLPPQLTHLRITSLEQPLTNLPPTLTHLHVEASFYDPEIRFPPSLIHLNLEKSKFFEPITSATPHITHLTLSHEFNSPAHTLPPSITHLTFGKNFNKPVDALPPNLVHLIFGFSFNRAVDKLPKSLTFLQFGDKFDCSVDQLPPQLTHLSLGMLFDRPLNHLPRTLQHLAIGSNFDLPLDFLPPSITHLTLYVHFTAVNEFFPFFFPTNLQQLNLEFAHGTLFFNLWERKIQALTKD